MLRRSRPVRMTIIKPDNRLSSSSILQPNQPIFQRRGPVHLYANKDVAMQGVTDDKYYGAKRFREVGRKWWANKAIRYYMIAMLVACFFSVYVWTRQYDAVIEDNGLVGKKKRPYKSRLTVVLDVDETILSFGDKAYRLRAPLVPRPFLAELLDYLSEIDCEVILWAASSDRYMKQVLSSLDPQGVRVSSFVTRDDAWYSRDYFYEKNIAWLKRNPNDTIIIENRPLSVRGCNANAVLVDDFVRAEYMESGVDHPPNDRALRTVKEIIRELEQSGEAVPRYLANRARRHPDIKEIPCHLAMRQMPDELAVGNFFFVGDKFKPGSQGYN
jgi:hypothetical protein